MISNKEKILEFNIESKAFSRKLIPWYLEHPNTEGKTIHDSCIQNLTNKLGLEYVDTYEFVTDTWFGTDIKYMFKFKVIDEQLFFLTKIKFGL